MLHTQSHTFNMWNWMNLDMSTCHDTVTTVKVTEISITSKYMSPCVSLLCVWFGLFIVLGVLNVGFSLFTNVYMHKTELFTPGTVLYKRSLGFIHSSCVTGSLCPLNKNSPFLPSFSSRQPSPSSDSVSLAILDSSYTWNYMVFALLCLLYLFFCNVCQVQLCCWKWPDLLLFKD